MIRHCVFLTLRPDHDPAELEAVYAGLAELCERLDGASGFVSGRNVDFEGKSPDYPSGFTVDFVDEAALRTYADHPEHQALGARLCGCCVGGYAGVTVFDLDVSTEQA